MEAFVSTAILLTIAGAFIYAAAPTHWQTPLGFVLITFGWLPVLLVILALLAKPVLLIPAAIILGILMVGPPRA